MTHPNRRQIRLPARLVDALAGALERALARLGESGPDRALAERGRKALAELRRRLAERGPDATSRPRDP